MSEYKLTVESFSVSYSIDVFKSGEKQGSFVSVTVKADPPIPLEDFTIAKLDASYQVAKATIHDALVRMTISEEEAVDRIRALQENTEAIRDQLLKIRARAAAAKAAPETSPAPVTATVPVLIED